MRDLGLLTHLRPCHPSPICVRRWFSPTVTAARPPICPINVQFFQDFDSSSSGRMEEAYLRQLLCLTPLDASNGDASSKGRQAPARATILNEISFANLTLQGRRQSDALPSFSG